MMADAATPMAAEPQTAKARYVALAPAREPYLIRARDCAKLTIPYLMPPLGFTETAQLPTPYQSLGARGVRTLAAKLLLSLFPPNTPFFKYNLDDFVLQQLTGRDDMRGEVEKALNARERATMSEIDASLFRVAAGVGLQHVVVSGNYLIYVPPKGKARGFRLDQYVVKRDAEGNLLEHITKETISPNVLPEGLRGFAIAELKREGKSEDKNVDLYTHVRRTDTNWEVYQEVCGQRVPDSDGSYPLDRSPWVVVRINLQPGEDYGRSYVEELLGDLDSLEGLSETLVEGSAAAARVVFLVKPNGVTSLSVVAKARNGDVKPGDANDVTVIQAQKQADLAVAREQANDIAQRLAYAFLLNTAIQRNAERVTAEEIRYMSQELDDALGGVHTLLSAEFQLPTVSVYEDRMEKNRKVPPLPKGFVKPTITTGIEAIGRGIDLRNLRAFTQDIVQTLGPELAFDYISGTEYIKRAAASYGIDTGGLIKSDQEVAQMQQMRKLEAMAHSLGPQAISQLGGMGKEVLKNQLQPTQGTDGQSAQQ